MYLLYITYFLSLFLGVRLTYKKLCIPLNIQLSEFGDKCSLLATICAINVPLYQLFKNFLGLCFHLNWMLCLIRLLDKWSYKSCQSVISLVFQQAFLQGQSPKTKHPFYWGKGGVERKQEQEVAREINKRNKAPGLDINL